MPVLLGIFFLAFLFSRQIANAEREAGKINRSKVPPKRTDKLSNWEKYHAKSKKDSNSN